MMRNHKKNIARDWNSQKCKTITQRNNYKQNQTYYRQGVNAFNIQATHRNQYKTTNNHKEKWKQINLRIRNMNG